MRLTDTMTELPVHCHRVITSMPLCLYVNPASADVCLRQVRYNNAARHVGLEEGGWVVEYKVIPAIRQIA